MNQEREYEQEIAERLLNLTSGGPALELRADGVYMTQEFTREAAFYADWLRWNPQWELLESDPQKGKLLPIPFSGRELAAFLLCPVASELMERFGDAGELDAQELADCFPSGADEMCKLALEDAYSHLERAVASVGATDSALFEVAQRLASDYDEERDAARARLGIASVSGHGLTDAEYSERIDQVNREVAALKHEVTAARKRAEAKQRDWLRRMVLALYEPNCGRQGDAATNTGTSPASNSARNASTWTVHKPKRFPGYTAPLYRLLAEAHRDGKPRPTARDVVEAWRTNRPHELTEVLHDGIKYEDNKGNTKAVELEPIRKAIGRMTGAR